MDGGEVCYAVDYEKKCVLDLQNSVSIQTGMAARLSVGKEV